MKNFKIFLLVYVAICANTHSFIVANPSEKEAKVKNIILMIPDGTSISLVSAARWYNFAQDNTKVALAIDPYICGLVKTYSSNSPIGDSAPTTSCYMTGVLSQTGFISTYPPRSPHDLIPLDSAKAYQPLTTVMEAASIVKNMKLGLVFTCEFPHATVADCIAHTTDRQDYNTISKQMLSKNTDVVFGGGVSLLSPQEKLNMEKAGYTVLLNDYSAFQNLNSPKAWSLFGDVYIPYEIDRNTDSIPSLAEMTSKALQLLDQENKNGFFLMVEGSKVDWAAHENDAKTMLLEFLAFDKAVEAALDFAKKDGNTMVIVMPDHGNSGISIGNSNTSKGYDTTPLSELFNHLDTISSSAHERAKILNKSVLELTSEINKKGKLGFTTYGHTGEDVFLAVYSPGPSLPRGLQTNVDMHRYMVKTLGLEGKLDSLTKANYSPHTEVFKGSKFFIDTTKSHASLRVVNKKNVLEAQANHTYVIRNGKKIELPSAVIYAKENGVFYLPLELGW